MNPHTLALLENVFSMSDIDQKLENSLAFLSFLTLAFIYAFLGWRVITQTKEEKRNSSRLDTALEAKQIRSIIDSSPKKIGKINVEN